MRLSVADLPVSIEGRPARSDRELRSVSTPVGPGEGPGFGVRRLARPSEQARIRQVMAGLDAGRGGMVLITGPAGIGKTFLAHSALQDLPSHVRTVTAGPLGYLPTPGLWPVRQIIRTLRRPGNDPAAPELLGDPGEVGEQIPYRLVEATVDLLVQLARSGPAVAVLDDFDRVDPLTVAVVEALGERIHSCPLVLLVCARSGGTTPVPATETLLRLRGRPQVLTLGLDGLPDDVMQHVVADVRAEIAPPDRLRIARISAGNPLLAQELALLWVAQQRIADAGGPLPGLPATPTLRELVAERLASVDADEVLAPLAILGRPATLQLLTRASGLPVVVVQRVVERAAVLGVVTVDAGSGRIELAHSVFTDVLLHRLTPEDTRHVHLRLASLFDRSPDIPGPHHVERARHLMAAGEHTDATADACLVAAAYEEGAGGHGAALELADYALNACDGTPATRVSLLRLRGRCLSRLGHTDAARRQLLRAVHTAQRTREARLFAAAVADLAAVDDTGTDTDAGERIGLLEQALNALGQQRGPLRGVLLARLAEFLHLSDPQRSRQLAQEALTAAGDDPTATRQAHQAWAVATGGVAQVGELERARSVLTAHGHGARADAFAVFLLPALIRGDRPAVDHYLARAGADTQPRCGARSRGLLSLARLGMAVSDADAEAVAALTTDTATEQISDIRMVSAVLHLFWQFHTLGPVAPQPSGRGRSAEVAAAPSAECADLLTLTRATMLALRGDPGAATWLRFRLGSSGVPAANRPGPLQDLTRAIAALAGKALADKEICRTAIACAPPDAGAFITLTTGLIGPVGWFTAHACSTLGDTADAVQANTSALEASRRLNSRTWTAQCLLQRAQLLAQEDPASAKELAKEAVGLVEGSPLITVAEQLGQVLGSLQAPRYPLNPRQLELLRLAAKGLRNDQIARRLYVSTATIERHLSQIYRTLGVANRAAATRWLSVHGPEVVMSPDPRTLPRATPS